MGLPRVLPTLIDKLLEQHMLLSRAEHIEHIELYLFMNTNAYFETISAQIFLVEIF